MPILVRKQQWNAIGYLVYSPSTISQSNLSIVIYCLSNCKFLFYFKPVAMFAWIIIVYFMLQSLSYHSSLEWLCKVGAKVLGQFVKNHCLIANCSVRLCCSVLSYEVENNQKYQQFTTSLMGFKSRRCCVSELGTNIGVKLTKQKQKILTI